ncbi:hypothetical protein H4Q26_004049 [Puccinia striiformis f. sp. tritici PST-130]|nr:hypothetical protein H4Q26_004049 [Puccinia striiformis f. sp. tritici PST-130]
MYPLQTHLITVSFANLVHRRRDLAIEASPSGGYEPIKVQCPHNFTVRVAGSDSDFLATKNPTIYPQKHGQSIRAGEDLPNIGIAMSGGGIRALIGGAGILDALDNRNPDAVGAGTGGILQLTNYITGLSGLVSSCIFKGIDTSTALLTLIYSWNFFKWILVDRFMVSPPSFYPGHSKNAKQFLRFDRATSNFPTFTSLNQTLWRLTESSSYTGWNSVKRYPKAIQQAKRKHKSGFPISLVDMDPEILTLLSFSLRNDTHHGSKVLFSSIRNTTQYLNHQAPFPILLCTSRVNGVSEINYDSPIYEFNPEEFGVCHPTLKAFIPIDDLGSRLVGGKPTGNDSCVRGASSNVLSQPGFNKFSWGNLLPEAYDKITKHIYDEAIVPNPFYHMGMSSSNGTGYPERESKNLYLADGGWGGEILPLWPLLQPDRKLDVIIAIDFSADGPSMFHGAYPNGTSLTTTYRKTQEEAYKNIHFPTIPDTNGTKEKSMHSSKFIWDSDANQTRSRFE